MVELDLIHDTGLDVEPLYRKYGHRVLRRARQMLSDEAEAEEVLQEIVMNLLAHREQFGGRSAPSTFLYSVTAHACLSRLRKRKKSTATAEGAGGALYHAGRNPYTRDRSHRA